MKITTFLHQFEDFADSELGRASKNIEDGEWYIFDSVRLKTFLFEKITQIEDQAYWKGVQDTLKAKKKVEHDQPAQPRTK